MVFGYDISHEKERRVCAMCEKLGERDTHQLLYHRQQPEVPDVPHCIKSEMKQMHEKCMKHT